MTPPAATFSSEAVAWRVRALTPPPFAFRPLRRSLTPSTLRPNTSENESVGGGYRVGAEDGSDTYVKSDASLFVVKVSSTSLTNLLDAELDDFAIAAEPIGAPDEGA